MGVDSHDCTTINRDRYNMSQSWQDWLILLCLFRISRTAFYIEHQQ